MTPNKKSSREPDAPDRDRPESAPESGTKESAEEPRSAGAETDGRVPPGANGEDF
jgi:hypothetical protein